MISIKVIGEDDILINPNQITQIRKDLATVVIFLSCRSTIRTHFTTIDHALDYIQRASSHSLVGG
jgi:hypothetical protein